jgi:hypothetical protein
MNNAVIWPVAVGVFPQDDGLVQLGVGFGSADVQCPVSLDSFSGQCGRAKLCLNDDSE